MNHPLDRPYVVKILENGKDIGEVSFTTRANAEKFKILVYPAINNVHRTIEGNPISAFVFVHEAAFRADTDTICPDCGFGCSTHSVDCLVHIID